jgi:hypothetical protein
MNTLRRHSCQQYSGWIHPDLVPLPDFLKNPHLLASDPAAHNLLDTQTRQIYRFPISLNGADTRIFVYLDRPHSVLRRLQRTYANRVRRISQKLDDNDIDTIAVLAALRSKERAREWTSVVVAREIPAVRQLPASERHFLDIHPQQDFTVEIAAALGGELANLHSKEFFHGDLKSRHVLYRSDTGGFYFVDLEKCGQHRLWPSFLKDILAARDMIQLLNSLPRDPEGEQFNDLVMTTYLDQRKLPARRKGRIKKWIRLYGQQGGFQQGRTFLENLTLLIRRSPEKPPPAN